MAVALVTNEAEAVREAEEDRLAKEAAEAEEAKKPKRNVLLEKQLSLLANCRGAPGERRSSSRRNNYTCNMIETGIVEPGTIH